MNSSLTVKQKRYAEKHHNLVLEFLDNKRLPQNEYYDVVIFGYFEAVQRYLKNKALREKFDFKVIAFRKMKDSLSSEYRMLNRQKRKGTLLSLDADDDMKYTLYDEVAAFNSVAEWLKTEELLWELSEILPPNVMEVIRLRILGYSPWEISHELKIPPPDVHELLRSAQGAALSVCAA